MGVHDGAHVGQFDFIEQEAHVIRLTSRESGNPQPIQLRDFIRKAGECLAGAVNAPAVYSLNKSLHDADGLLFVHGHSINRKAGD